MTPTMKSVLQSEEDVLLREVHLLLAGYAFSRVFLLEELELEWWQKNVKLTFIYSYRSDMVI